MATTFCTSGQAIIKAGRYANSGAVLIPYIDGFVNEAEAVINNVCRHNFITKYSTLNSGAKLILQEAASNLAGINIINYDMSAYPSRIEAEDKINVLRDAALRDLSLIRDKKVQEFIRDKNGA